MLIVCNGCEALSAVHLPVLAGRCPRRTDNTDWRARPQHPSGCQLLPVRGATNDAILLFQRSTVMFVFIFKVACSSHWQHKQMLTDLMTTTPPPLPRDNIAYNVVDIDSSVEDVDPETLANAIGGACSAAHQNNVLSSCPVPSQLMLQSVMACSGKCSPWVSFIMRAHG